MARLPMVNSLLEFRPGGFSLRVNHVQLTPQTHDSHRFIRGHAPLSSFHAAFRYPPMNHAQLGRTLFLGVRQRSWDLDTLRSIPHPWIPAFFIGAMVHPGAFPPFIPTCRYLEFILPR
jgi:hypothetical protein